MTDIEEAEVTAWFGERAERTIETACARVFLTGDTAFKVKRRVEHAIKRALDPNNILAPGKSGIDLANNL